MRTKRIATLALIALVLAERTPDARSTDAAFRRVDVGVPSRAPGEAASALHPTTDTTVSRENKSAKDALERFIAYIATLRATSELTKANVEQAMGIRLGEDEEGDFYRSPGLGGGWTYIVRRSDHSGHWKVGLTFGFVNPDAAADPTPICVATFNQIRTALVFGGFDEAITPGEIGQTIAWNFIKSDLVFTMTPSDISIRSDGTECVLAIHTTGGRKT